MKNVGGRPTLYTPELAARICELISIEPMSVKKICEKYKDIPGHDTVMAWVHKDLHGFSGQYYKAKEHQADALADYTWERAQDVEESKDAIAKAALELKFAQWQNARLAPKRWRESTQTESKVDVNVHEQDLKALK